MTEKAQRSICHVLLSNLEASGQKVLTLLTTASLTKVHNLPSPRLAIIWVTHPRKPELTLNPWWVQRYPVPGEVARRCGRAYPQRRIRVFDASDMGKS
jgi:hypothetical protein